MEKVIKNIVALIVAESKNYHGSDQVTNLYNIITEIHKGVMLEISKVRKSGISKRD